MKKKKIVAVLLFLCSFYSVFAVSIDYILSSAEKSSKKMETIRLNKSNSDMQIAQEDAKETVLFTISSGDVTFQKDKKGEHYFSMNPSFELSFPDNEGEDDFELSVGLSNESDFYVSGKNSQTYTPNANFSKTFSLDSYTDNRKDLTKEMNREQQNLNYQTNLLQFDNAVIESVISIIKSSVSVEEAELSFSRLTEDYETDIEAGNLTKESMAELERLMKIESAKASFDVQKAKYIAILEEFQQDYGFSYAEVDEVRECNLNFNSSSSKNSDIRIKAKALEIAKQNYEAKIGIAQKLTIGTNMNAPIKVQDGKEKSITLNGSTSASINGSNYSFGISVGAEYCISERNIYPYVTISGRWSNKSEKESDDLEVQTLKNKMILAEIDYQNAVESYTKELRNILDEIDNYKSECSQFEIQAKYDAQILDKAQQLYSLGLISARELQDARMNVRNDERQKIILALNGLKLENNIAIMQY